MSKANLHVHCHDLVCNANPAYPRGAKGIGCSCRGRESRAAKTGVASELRIAELEDSLRRRSKAYNELDEEHEAVLAALHRLAELLRRLRGWDVMDGTSDGPFWRKEITDALAATENP